MHIFSQWLLHMTVLSGDHSPVQLWRTKPGAPQGPALCFKVKEPKSRSGGYKTAPEKQVEAATKQQRCFLVLFSPVYFSLKQSLLGTKVCRELQRAAVVP